MPLPANLSRRAVITGITGQDGSYLAELLLNKGYEVHGIIRRASTFNTHRLEHLYQDRHDPQANLFLHYGDVTDAQRITNLVLDIEPDEIYNLAAQSHVRVSFDEPIYTVDVAATGALAVLEAARRLNKLKEVRVYQASSSEMFGAAREAPQTEATPFYPRSPYACAKVYAYHQTVNYREAYDLFACNGILFNHESPRRGETFVTRKITRAATRIKEGLQDKLHLGNLESRRDWGYAKEFVEAMWLMLQGEEPGDYVIATNETHTIREFLEAAFQHLDLDWREFVGVDPRYFRPTEVDVLLGDYSKAREILGWEPRTTFNGLVQIMVEADRELAKEERFAQDYAQDRLGPPDGSRVPGPSSGRPFGDGHATGRRPRSGAFTS
jgi:GDPmannose 4,6-dehydratase